MTQLSASPPKGSAGFKEEKLSVSGTGAKKRGRPKGSKNKQTVSKTAVEQLKRQIGPYLPDEDMDYLEGILSGKVKPELAHDLDMFLALQLKALLPLLADEIKTGTLTREGTQRSSTVKELLALRFQMEKHDKGDDDDDAKTFITNIFAARGIDPGAILAGISDGPGGSPGQLPQPVPVIIDHDGGSADEPGSVPEQLPERHVEVPAGSEE